MNPSLSRRSLIGGLACAAWGAAAQSFDVSRPVTVVMPVAPGGGLDYLMRTLLPVASERLGQPILLDYKPGGNGVVSVQQVKSARPDGHTFLLAYPSFVMNPRAMSKPPYAESDFQPVGLVAKLPAVLAVHGPLPIQGPADLIAFDKSLPGALTVGIAGTGGLLEYSLLQLKKTALPGMMIVPYKGGAPALNAVLAGEIAMTLESWPAVEAHVKSGRIRPIAVSSAGRQSFAPALPALGETFPGFDMSIWYGLMASAKAPNEAVRAVAKAFSEALNNSEVATRLAGSGWELGKRVDPNEFGLFLSSERRRLGPLVDEFASVAR